MRAGVTALKGSTGAAKLMLNEQREGETERSVLDFCAETVPESFRDQSDDGCDESSKFVHRHFDARCHWPAARVASSHRRFSHFLDTYQGSTRARVPLHSALRMTDFALLLEAIALHCFYCLEIPVIGTHSSRKYSDAGVQ